MPRRLALLVVIAAMMAIPAAPVVTAAEPDLCREDLTAGSILNVEVLCRIPTPRHQFDSAGNVVRDPTTGLPVETQTQVTALNFLAYDADTGKMPRSPARDVMFAVGRFGLKSFDVSDPSRPVLLDWLGDGINDPPIPSGNAFGGLDGFWQNEDMEVDPNRKLVLLSRDPRAYGGTTQTGESGLYIISALDPTRLRVLSYVELPAGHTSTCINDCNWLWTGGPASSTAEQPAWPGGRPIIVTDIRDPRNPKVYPDAIDLFRRDGVTAYSHDVQVDDAGIAWVSGSGGVRGYWTKGRHFDPLLGRARQATAWDPVPYAGGGIEESAAPSRFLHNSAHPSGADAADPSYGDLIYATEERFESDCATDGRFVIASLEGSYDGQGWRSTATNPFRLKTVGTWQVDGQAGSSTVTDCSAHYFQLAERMVAYSFYSQGVRFLDVSDPTNPIQVGYFRPDGGTSWAPYWHDGLLYTADAHGIYVLRPTVAAGQVTTAVSAPVVATAPVVDRLARPNIEPAPGYTCAISNQR
jgi:hypothetical protein